jgi:hypothetical protein
VSGIVITVLVFFVLACGLGGAAYFIYQRKLRRAKAIERGLKMVPILIHLPPPSSDTQGGNRDVREVMREKTAQAEVLYNLMSGTAMEGFGSKFYGQRHIALELIAVNSVVHFFVAVPVALVSVVTKAVQTAYPGARLEEVEDHNIFNQEGRLAATLGGEMVLRKESAYPIATYSQLERDPMEALLTTISALEKKDGVAIQIMMRPADRGWASRSIKLANGKRKGRSSDIAFSAMDLAKAAVKAPDQQRADERARLGGGQDISNLQLSEIEKIEEKTKHPGFEILARVIVSTESVARSQQLLRDIATAFALFETPGLNGFKFLPALDVQGLVTAFIFRFFPPELKSNILNSVELATLFHLPDSQFTPASSVVREHSKQVDGPVHLPTVGLLYGFNDFRGVKKEIRLSEEDRRRHTYILGQTGTGKSTMLENLAVQDMVNGKGFAFIDPHGDSAEKLLALVPKERAEDVIYFNPADTQYPLGINLFEFTDASQKDFLVQETINMLYKLYDPGHTGIIGPRYEHWYRNAALTLMSDPNGATFIEIPKVFTDTDYLKQKFKYLRDPTVIDFWTKEMGQTSDYHKSEMLGWFVSKFGAFQNNEMMRNIIGQTKSAFNLREVMDQKKILIVNLSKGRVGELNSQLLGMIFVIKFQAAAMSRANVPESERSDFCLYVDEFQNFSTDSFASILSEARKYRLNLIVANQFVGQLSNEIRDAVFGNIGTIVAHRMGPEDAEFMVKQFAPVFDVSDLVNIPNYNAAMRLMVGGLPSQPFTIRDSPPIGQPNLELGLAIKQLSAAKYGHDRARVEAEIMDRLSSRPTEAVAPAMSPTLAPAPAVAQVEPAAIATPIMQQPAAPVEPMQPVPSPVQVAPQVQVASVAQPMPQLQVAPMPSPTVPADVAPIPVATQPMAPVSVAAPTNISPADPAMVVAQAVPYVPDPTVTQAAPVIAPQAGPIDAPSQYDPAAVPVAGQLQEDASQTNFEGGFADLGAPLGAPSASDQPMPPVMAITPPPIGAPPIEVPGASAPLAPPVSAPAVQSYASPAIPQPMPQPALVAPNPINPLPAQLAAPVIPGVYPTVATPPVAAAPAAYPAPMPQPMTAVASVPMTAGYQTDPLGPPPIGAPPITMAGSPSIVPAASAPVTSAPALVSAPPVGIPVAAVEPLAALPPSPIPMTAPSAPAVSDPATLSLSDITGGRPPGPRAVDLASIPVVGPAAPPQAAVSPPSQPVVAVAPAVSQVVAEPAIPLGSGMPLAGDPYANIDVIGDMSALDTPTPVPAPVRPSVAETAIGLPPVGKPLPGDPYAAVDVMGNARPSLGAAPQPVAPVEAQAPAIPAVAPMPQPPVSVQAEPVSMAPAPLYNPPVAGSSPMSAALPLMPPAAATSALAPVSVVQQPAPAAPIVTQPALMPTIAPLPELTVPVPAVQPLQPPAPVAQPIAQPVVPQMPTSVAQPVAVEVPAPQMAIAPVPALPAPVASPMPEPVPRAERLAAASVAEPVVSPAVSEPIPQPVVDEPMIHFVDPGAEALLHRPDLPNVDQAFSEDELLRGLPDGVALSKPAPAAPAPSMAMPAAPVPVALPVAPAASAPIAPAPAAPVPEPVRADVAPTVRPTDAPVAARPEVPLNIVGGGADTATVAPVGEAATAAPASETKPVPDESLGLENMAKTPPPIGAKPVELDAAAAPKLAEEPKSEVKAKVQEPEPIPEPNANLAKALQEAPPEPIKTETVKAAPLVSVAAMLEKAKASKKQEDQHPAPAEGKLEQKSDSKPELAAENQDEAKTPAREEKAAGSSDESVEHVTSQPAAKSEDTVPESEPEPEAPKQPEHEVDSLLSVSLIQSDTGESHRRLPESIDLQRSDEGERGMDLEFGSHPAPTLAKLVSDAHPADHHGLKVIQPLEPIVPPKEQFAKELAAMSQAEQASSNIAAESKADESKKQQLLPKTAVEPVRAAGYAVAQPTPAKPAEAVAPPKPQGEAAPAAPDAIMKHEGELLPESAPAVIEGVTPADSESESSSSMSDSGLPPAESLAVEDVAKARAEREANAAMQKAAPAQSEPVATPASEPAQPHAGNGHDNERFGKRKRKHGAQKAEKIPEQVESEEEAEHNKPTEAEQEQGMLTGKLILPTGEKPKPEPVQPKVEKPKKLSPGEVFVDEKGNVMIGE